MVLIGNDAHDGLSKEDSKATRGEDGVPFGVAAVLPLNYSRFLGRWDSNPRQAAWDNHHQSVAYVWLREAGFEPATSGL